MNIVYTIGLIAAFISGFFVALISVKVGLKWRIELSQGKEPTLNINPIAPIVETMQQNKVDKANKDSANLINEWLYGDGGK